MSLSTSLEPSTAKLFNQYLLTTNIRKLNVSAFGTLASMLELKN